MVKCEKYPIPPESLAIEKQKGRNGSYKKPDVVAIETLFFNTNVKTAITVAHARGIVLLCASQKGIPDFEYTPLQVKQALTGYGRADKAQIQSMVKIMLGLNAVPKPDDTADALAIAVCHAHSHNLSSKGYI